MALYKLANGPVVMTVTGLEATEGNFGPQFKVTGQTADDLDACLFVNSMPLAQQLARLQLTTDTAVGRTLRFEQVKKDGKTFTNVTLAGSLEAGTAPSHTGAGVSASAPRAAGQSAPAKVTVPEAAAVYAECVDAAMATLGTKLEQANVPVSDMAIQAAAATLFIKVTK